MIRVIKKRPENNYFHGSQKTKQFEDKEKLENCVSLLK